jgi:hypothetical protein
MTIHSIPQIGSILRNAVTFNFKNSREVLKRAEFIPVQVEQLFNLLDTQSIDYVLVNGVALLTYLEGRNTQDIDLIMALPSLAKLPEIKITSQDMYFARGNFGELQIDILLTKNPLFEKEAKQYSAEKQFLDHKIRCATVEGLLLLKLFALPSLYRQGSFERVGIYENDIATLIHAFNPDMQSLMMELKTHLNETDMTEARNILVDIEGRIQRFRKTSK